MHFDMKEEFSKMVKPIDKYKCIHSEMSMLLILSKIWIVSQ